MGYRYILIADLSIYGVVFMGYRYIVIADLSIYGVVFMGYRYIVIADLSNYGVVFMGKLDCRNLANIPTNFSFMLYEE